MTGLVGVRRLIWLLPLFMGSVAGAADLRPETVRAWNAYVAAAERRMEAGIASPVPQGAGERAAALGGEIPVAQVGGGEGHSIPGGLIHHWRGTVFIPGRSLDFVLDRVANPDLDAVRQEDVIASRVIERGPGRLRLYLQLQRSAIVTVVYNTEHDIVIRRRGKDRASSRSVATRIAEIEDFGEKGAKELPPGRDRGFLWRMHSYWRYHELGGGVLVECESITLSRSAPLPLRAMIFPIVRGIAKESMIRTLESLRERLLRGGGASSPRATLSLP